MLFHTLAIDGTCNYYEDGRRSTMEVIPLASTDPRVTPMYNRLIEAGFRRDSTLPVQTCLQRMPSVHPDSHRRSRLQA